MPKIVPVSIVVLTKNEEKRLPDCLESVRFADEILVVDDESTDRTEEVARRYTDKILHRKMDLEGRHRNWAAQRARNEWILSIDADERVTPELSAEIQTLFSGTPEFQIYSIPRRNFIGKRWLRHGGWYPSPQVKLYKRGAFRWEETTVHCRAISEEPWGSLKGDLLHYSYRDLEDFIGKLNRQTTLEADKWVRDGRKMTRGKALWRTVDRFTRSYFGKKGYKDGWIGFAAAVLGGLYQLVSYAKYWETCGETAEISAAGDAGRRTRRRARTAAKRGPDGRREYLQAAGPAARESLAVVLMTKNEGKRLPHCLDQVKGWADEIVVIDDESADRTVEIALGYTPKVFVQRSNDNHDRQWNTGSEKASSEWILHIDADEIVTPALKTAIDRALTQPNGVCAEARGGASSSAGVSAYDLMRLNFFLGRPMRHGGWRHKHRILFRRAKSRCVGQGIHVKLQVDGPVGFLDAEIKHYPFQSLSQFIDRQNHYTTVEAEVMLKEKGKLPWKEAGRQMVWRPAKLFWKSYVKQGAWRDGATGFFFAALFAYFHHALWAKYWEKTEAA
jgi:glycosyltransferase involved in cell wall biosynthesis